MTNLRIGRDLSAEAASNINRALVGTERDNPNFQPLRLPAAGFFIAIVGGEPIEALGRATGRPCERLLDDVLPDPSDRPIGISVLDIQTTPPGKLHLSTARAILGQARDKHINFDHTVKLTAGFVAEELLVPPQANALFRANRVVPRGYPRSITFDLGWGVELNRLHSSEREQALYDNLQLLSGLALEAARTHSVTPHA